MATKAQDYKARQLSAKKFKTVPHQFTIKVFNWLSCTGCGLVTLKNEATRKRMTESCVSMED
jgi:hypothetical protein